MTQQEFAKIVEAMKIGTITKGVATVYYNAKVPVTDKYVSDEAGVSIKQVMEALRFMKRGYGIEFIKYGKTNHHRYYVLLNDPKVAHEIENKIDLSGMTAIHRTKPWCYALGLAKLPQPV